MKVLIFSDSHRELSYMRRAIESEQPDYVFHLGDHDSDAAELERECPLLPIAAVCGNCDAWGSDSPNVRLVTLGGLRIFLCHGHTYGVKRGLLRVTYAAREAQADILLFGHTHEPYREKDRYGMTLFNPGSCGYGRPTYGCLTIPAEGKYQITLKEVK